MTMIRIIWHHTGGPYRPTGADLAAYHRVIDGEGEIHPGRHQISANAPGRALTAGSYAAHTRGLNTGAIGLALACMGGADWGDPKTWRLPRPAQIDALIAETARLCRDYRIQPGPRSTLSHAEVEITLGVKQAGKWDFDYPLEGSSEMRDPVASGPKSRDSVAIGAKLRFPVASGGKLRDPVAIGDRLRKAVCRALGELAPAGVTPAKPSRPVLRRGSFGAAVRELQILLGRRFRIGVDGQFGPATHAAVIAFQRASQLLPDGIVGPLTWAALVRL